MNAMHCLISSIFFRGYQRLKKIGFVLQEYLQAAASIYENVRRGKKYIFENPGGNFKFSSFFN